VHGLGITGEVTGTDKHGNVEVRNLADGKTQKISGKSVSKVDFDPANHGLVKQMTQTHHASPVHSAPKAHVETPAAPAPPAATHAATAVDKHGKPIAHGDAVMVKPNEGHFGGAFTARVDKVHDGGKQLDVQHLKTGETHTVGSHQTMSLGRKAPEAPKPLGEGNRPKPDNEVFPGVPKLDQHGSLPKPKDEVFPGVKKPAEPAVKAPAPAPATKEGHELAQGDTIHAYGADGSKKTLKINGIAKSNTGHTVTATDATGKQHRIAVNHGAKVQMAPPQAKPNTPRDEVLPPLDDKQLKAHVAAVESTVDAAVKRGLSTDKTMTLDGKGQVWNPERAKLHNEIVNDLYGKAANVPNEGKGLFSGGLGGAGKTTTLANPKTGIDQSQFLTINPDDIKEIMAERGMIPDIPGEVPLSPMEKVSLIHEESSHIANLLAQRAYADKKNVTWDITMASEGSVAKRIAEMKKNGYTNLDAVFVDIPVEKSVQRAMARYRRGMEAYRNGQGAGGRYVPPSVIRKNASTSFSSANRENFEKLRDQFNNWQVWDNSVDGREPRLVYSKASPDLARLTAEARSGLTDSDKQQEVQAA